MPKSGTEETEVLSSILEGLPLGVWVARAPSGELVYANGAFAEILGMVARDDVRAGGYAPAYHLRDREGRTYPEARLPFAQVVARRETVVVDDITIQRADGTCVDVRAVGKPLFDGAGTLTHVIVAFTDVTAELRAEAAIQEVRERLSTALQHAPVILYAYDREGVVTVSEGAGLSAMGFKSGELVGRSLFELYGEHTAIMDNHRRVLAGETFTSVATVGAVVLESWMAPLRDAQGAITGAIGVSTDVTERLRLQGQAADTERLAAMGRLAASVGHEINNPLSFAIEAVRLAREASAAGGDDPGATRARIDELLADAGMGLERVRLITRDLKAFARVDEVGSSGPQDLGRALTAATKMVATRTGPRARMELVVGPPATVVADETRLVQIFVNLILNAVDALPADRAAENRITVRSRVEGGWAVVEVADNGPGIEPGLRDRVFDPFFTTKPVGEGTGLGLFVSRNLVEALGGTIAVCDAPGGGALFTIRLPTGGAVAPKVTPAPPETRAPTAARPRILIVDDEALLATVFRKALEPDYDVRVFTSGRLALAHLLDESPAYDLVLCDLMMADVSGMTLHEELARHRPGLERAIVFMTGGVFDPKVAAFLASVPNDCLDKPFDVRAEVRCRLTPPG